MVKEIDETLAGFAFAHFLPRVARCSQPWAESFNPFGIGKPIRTLPNAKTYYPENSEEPERILAANN